MNFKVLLGLSIAAGAVAAGGVYHFINSDTAVKMSVGHGLVASGVKLLNSYAKSDVARGAISAIAGVTTAFLVPTINYFVSKLFSYLGVRYFVKQELTKLLPQMRQTWKEALSSNKAPGPNLFTGADSIARTNSEGKEFVLVPNAKHIKPEKILYLDPKAVQSGVHYVIFDRTTGKVYSNEDGQVATLSIYYNFDPVGSRSTYLK